MEIPQSHQDLLKDETKAFAVLGTVMKDGSPQVTPIWFNWDGKNLWINTAKGRVKDRNLSKRPLLALTIIDPKNPYRYIQIRGKVADSTEENAREHIVSLNVKYHGNPNYPVRPGEVRVKYRIEPLHVNVSG